MTEFVLVPGGWYGGWVFEAIEQALGTAGQSVQSMTLAGLGEASSPAANLSTHVAETVDVIRKAAGPVVLCGHSYGGMVITGAADAVPDKIGALVYLDAYVPENGDTTWSLTTSRFRDMFVAGAVHDGYACVPPAGMDPRCRPHPMAAFLEAAHLTGSWRSVRRKIYVGAHGWDGSPFLNLFDRLRSDPDWMTVSIACGHNIPRLAPDRAAEILLEAAA